MAGSQIIPNYSQPSGGYTDSPHKESLTNIIDEFVAVTDENDYHYHVSRRAVVLYARRGLQELHFNASKEMRALRFTIPDSGIVKAPLDMVEPVRVSLLDENGFLWPMYRNDQLQITQEYVLDDSDDIIFDSNGYFVTSDTTAFYNNIQQVVSSDETYGYINLENNIDKFSDLQFITYQLHLVNDRTGDEKYQTVTFYIPEIGNDGSTVDSVKDLLENTDFLTQISNLEYVTDANIGKTPGTSFDNYEGFHIETDADWSINPQLTPRADLSFPTDTNYDILRVNPNYWNTIGKGGATKAQGGMNVGSGYFQFYRQFHEFRFFSNIGENIVIEYVSDPFLESSLDNLLIHKYFVDALKAYIYYNIISSKSNVPMNEKERARRRWGTEYKNARKKIGLNQIDRINQVLRRSRNMNKW